MIRAKNIQPDTILRMGCRQILIPYADAQNAYIMAAAAGSTMQAFPFSLNASLLETTMRYPHSVCITQSAGAGVFTLTFVGENQFGEVITETVSTTGASDNIHTKNCFRKLTSVSVSAAPNTAVTISLGWRFNVTNNGNPRLPLPFKPVATASVKNVSMLQSGAQPSFAVIGAATSATSGAYVLSISGNALSAGPGFVTCIIDEDEPNA